MISPFINGKELDQITKITFLLKVIFSRGGEEELA